MAEKTTIARPYAKAAFREAQGDNRLTQWSETLRAAATAVRDPRVHELLGSPSVSGEDLAQFVMGVTGAALDEHGQNFFPHARGKASPRLPARKLRTVRRL